MKESHTKVYRRLAFIWLALLALLATTAGSAFVPMGTWNSVVNFLVAGAKALLVAIFFMHLRDSRWLIRIVAVIAVFMLALLFTLSGADYFTRREYRAPWQDPEQIAPIFKGPS